MLLRLILSTILLDEVITNNATAALNFAVAIAAAARLGVEPRPFALGVAVAVSASFPTPSGLNQHDGVRTGRVSVWRLRQARLAADARRHRDYSVRGLPGLPAVRAP